MFKRLMRAPQFRLSSAIVMMIVAGVLIGLNMRPAEANTDYKFLQDVIRQQHILARFNGWPLSNTAPLPDTSSLPARLTR